MRRTLGLIAAIGLLALVGLAWAQPTAKADDNSWRLTDYRSEVTLVPAGIANVRTTFTFDFGSDPGHGPSLTFPLRQEIADDPAHWRMLDVTVQDASSPSGADATLDLSQDDGNLLVRIGRESRTFTGEQTYQLNYRIRGLIAPQQAQSGLDEFNWNAVGLGWEIPIDHASVEVTGPAQVTRSACFQGEDYRTPCQAEQEADTASFSAAGIGDGSGVQVVAGFPAGTFVGAEPRLAARFNPSTAFTLNSVTGAVTALLTAIGLGAVLAYTRRAARDEVFLGMAPGVVPAAEAGATTGPATKVPLTVQFTPPADARPGEVGTLIDATVDSQDITATILDLAVRGHLRISQGSSGEWVFERQASQDSLVDYEAELLELMFSRGDAVTTSQLGQQHYADLQPAARQALNTRVARELKWYRAEPGRTRLIVLTVGAALVVLSIVLMFLLGYLGWGLIPLAGVATGLLIIFRSKKFGRRTALGSAILAQARGFELYLRTAEADQIRFEEGIDVFSRYLPYAVVFGVAERWTTIFNELAADGRYQFDTPWCPGSGYGIGYGFAYSSFADSMSGLSHSMSASMQAASQATSGGSGFGGGGFSGGGGGFGGGGGGGW